MLMRKQDMALAVQRVVFNTDGSDLEKLSAAFGVATDQFIDNIENEMALARAMGDEETAIKEQIKANVMRTAREIFTYCYTATSGDRTEVLDE
jgi:hypothetical protein